jgi:two-component system sensor kinase FixL
LSDAVIIDERGRITAFNAAAERLFDRPADRAIGQPLETLMRDLTSQRRAERREEDLDARLTDVARYSLMSEMCSGIAHEINQPLGAIATYAQAGKRLASANSPDRDKLVEIYEKIATQAARAGSVIKNLREFIGRQETRSELLDLNHVVESGIGLIENNARAEGVDLIVEYSAESLLMEGDLAQLHQVLYNLARNGLDALRLVEQEKWLQIKTEAVSENLVRFVVSDCGPGVPPDLLDGIFHPFVTTKEHGLGVGLAMSRSIVRSHVGRLTHASNESGRGAVFTVSLPRIQPK